MKITRHFKSKVISWADFLGDWPRKFQHPVSMVDDWRLDHVPVAIQPDGTELYLEATLHNKKGVEYICRVHLTASQVQAIGQEAARIKEIFPHVETPQRDYQRQEIQ